MYERERGLGFVWVLGLRVCIYMFERRENQKGFIYYYVIIIIVLGNLLFYLPKNLELTLCVCLCLL